MRSIKPEMFRSFTVSGWPVPVRWTFAGLLTYLDDEGRGADDARLIKAEVYPLDDDMTARKVEQHLSTVAGGGPLCRYEVGGRRYLHITSWAEHQRINRPTKSRNPPCPLHEPSLNGSPPPHGKSSEPARSTPDTNTEPSRPRAQAGAPAEHGAREQGSKGARDPAAPDAHARARDGGERTAAQRLAAWYSAGVRLANTGQALRTIADALAEGVSLDLVAGGVDRLIAEQRSCTRGTLRIAILAADPNWGPPGSAGQPHRPGNPYLDDLRAKAVSGSVPSLWVVPEPPALEAK